MPKVSVVMPSLNVRPYIEECMDSVIRQTLKDIEILCVDAGSTDGTLEVLRGYAERDSRVRVIVSDRKSYGYQMNLGIEAAAGEYLGIVETDDYIAPEMYEQLYAAAKAQALDIVKADYTVFTGEGPERQFIPCRIAGSRDQYGRVLCPSVERKAFFNTLYTWSGIYRTAFLKENGIRHNETPGASYQDNGFWFQTFALAERLCYVPKRYYYLRRDNLASSVFARNKVFAECVEYDFIRDFLRLHPELEPSLAPVCAYHRCRNYFGTLERIGEEDKNAFLERFASDFRQIEAAGELDRELFSRREWNALCAIMERPEAYFALKKEKTLPGMSRSRLEGGLRCLKEHGLRYTVKYVLNGGRQA